MKKKIEDPLNSLEKNMGKLEGNLQRSGKIMNNMQQTVEKIRFQGQKAIEKQQSEPSLVRRPEVQTGDVDDGCAFSGTASGKSANVKVNLFLVSSLPLLLRSKWMG